MDSKLPTSGSHVSAWSEANITHGGLSASSQQSFSHCHANRGAAMPPMLEHELDEQLASHDSFLEYINSMLMDETFEDSSWQLLAHNVGAPTDSHSRVDNITCKRPSSFVSLNDQYEHIFKGFHEILDEDTSNPLLFGSTEIQNGTSDKLVAYDLESPAEVHGREFPPSCFLQHSEEHGYEDGHMHVFEYEVSLEAPMMEVVAEGKKQQMEPSFVKDNSLPAATHHLDVHRNGSTHRSLHGQADTQDVSLVKNADLPAELYAQLFDECPLKTKEAALSSARSAGGRHPRSEGRRDEALENPVDLKALLLSSAKAVGDGNVRRAMDILQQVQQEGVSPHGSGLQRVVLYFSEALMVRLSGMGNTFYKAIANSAQLPSPLTMIKAYKMVFEACPYVKIAYHFANQYILKAATGASRLHIVDYGILYGFQWPCLIYALAHRHGGPPFVRITGIEFPAIPADMNPMATTEGTSQRLKEYARTYNVPFEYHAISVSKWEDIDAASLGISQAEVLVLNSFNRLHHIHDESIIHPSPRDRLLKQMRSLNPHLLVMGSMNAGHNSPFFAPRFREAFYYYSNMFDVLHTTMMNDSPERLMFERELMGRAILNVVACEGVERVEVPETYRQWQARILRAGFCQLPIIPSVLDTARAVMKRYHKDFDLLHDSNKWLLLGWRGRSMQALSAWEPAGRK